MIDHYLFWPVVSGLCLSLIAGPLGSMTLWKRMAYLGDATAHAAILGISLAIWLQFEAAYAIFGTVLIMGGLVFTYATRGMASDAVLGVFSQGALATALLLMNVLPRQNVDAETLLFGDILFTTGAQGKLILGVACLIAVGLWWRWSAMLLRALHHDLAVASDIDPRREDFYFTLMLAGFIATAATAIGVFLVSALLIIPAAAARLIAQSPERMALMASAIGAFSVIIGFISAYIADISPGPTMIFAAFTVFLILSLRRSPT